MTDTTTGQHIFLFAHQDDEYGVFHAISEAIKLGNDVWCVFVTDGGPAFERRNLESIKVLSHFGVDKNKILFIGKQLGIEDGKLLRDLKILADWLGSFLASHKSIRKIFVPAWEGGHPDHDILHAVSATIANRYELADKVWQFSLYNGYQCPAPFFRVMHPISSNGEIVIETIPFSQRFGYIRKCFHYRSQMQTWMGLFPFVFYAYIFIGQQRLQKISLERLDRKPHSGCLYYEYRGFSTWEDVEYGLKSLTKEFG